MASRTYEITFRGEAVPAIVDAFEDFDVTVGAGRTTLRGEQLDQAALHGAIRPSPEPGPGAARGKSHLGRGLRVSGAPLVPSVGASRHPDRAWRRSPRGRVTILGPEPLTVTGGTKHQPEPRPAPAPAIIKGQPG